MGFEIIEDYDSYLRTRSQPYVEFKIDSGGQVLFDLKDVREEWDYEPEIPDFDGIVGDKIHEVMGILPSSFVEFAVRMPDKKKNAYVPFSFDGRRYLRQIYDTPSRRTLLKCGRQVEKCAPKYAKLLDNHGRWVSLGDVSIGFPLLTMAGDGSHITENIVTWVSDTIVKPCIRIYTRQGHSIDAATTHPVRVWGGWQNAGDLKVGNRIAVIRKGGEFGSLTIPNERICLTAFLIGDGGLTQGINFTAVPGLVLDDFINNLRILNIKYTVTHKEDNKALMVRVSSIGKLNAWLKEDHLNGKGSLDKFIPKWVFDLPRQDTALFINRLWSTDGHVKKNAKSKYSIEYCSISIQLIREVQSLLWKFGIPSGVRTNWPNYWKKRGIQKYAYILRIETSPGVRTFLSEIGALGKSEGIPLPDSQENNNRDTYPIEINNLIREIIDTRGTDSRFGRFADSNKSLRTHGLRETLKYPPSRDKLETYVGFFRSDERYDQKKVDLLEVHIDTDLYWDEVESIVDMGNQDCIDIEVKDTHNFILAGAVTHNSTLLGNKLLAYACIIQALGCLYVSPTNQQTKVFSQDRLKEPVETSEYLKSWTTTKLSDNVFLKKFINRSQVTLRYCYMSADRVRGIPADVICVDELQDILTDNIPIIEQCASHSPYKIYMYSGTPKSLDNTIEHYWTEFSTQNEWMVPCHRHAIMTGGGKISNVYWNVLDETNIGKTSLICDKCKNPINAGDDRAQWVAMNPGIIHRIPKPYEGFRIPQLMVPWVPWEEIIQNQLTYPRGKFYNEVLGLSYDSGTRPLTRKDVMDNCDLNIKLDVAFQEKMRKHLAGTYPIYAGVDWGCHDDQTKILTTKGFVYFKDLTDEDKVAQWDPETREMTFVLPKVRTVRDWDQPLLHFQGKGLDMMLTATHRMRVNTQQNGEWGHWLTEGAGETASRGGNVKFVGFVDWRGTEEDVFVLPGVPKSSGYPGSNSQTFKMDRWLEFMGFYLSEGGLALNDGKPTCIKMSQRETVNPGTTEKIRSCLLKNDIKFSEFPNPKTGDINWTIYGKQLWSWMEHNVGLMGNIKRIPREFMNLSKRQLQILFDALMLGDGTVDLREGTNNGAYHSTSKGLCEDFQELCVKLGLRSTLSLHKPAEGGRKTRWRVSWSAGRDFQFNTPNQRVKEVPYNGKVYCCSVPTGYIVTERNGRIAYQGNTGENTYTVMSLGTYLQDRFTIFYIRRFEGPESEPDTMMEIVMRDIDLWQVRRVGCDYGGGFWPNDRLLNRFGWERIVKYQYSTPNAKVKWEDGLKRYLINRTEVMSDIFNAIKKRTVFRFPVWEHFQNPFGSDMLNIFSEFNEQRRENVYKKSPSSTDDSFHSILLCFLTSMIDRPRPDVVAPMRDHRASEDD